MSEDSTEYSNTNTHISLNESFTSNDSELDNENNQSNAEDLSYNELLNIFPPKQNHSHFEEENFDISKLYFTSKGNVTQNAINSTSPIKNRFNVIAPTESESNQVAIKKKRGRQVDLNSEEKINQKVHDKFSTDNLIRKIQVHYMSFIISITNDILKALNYEKKFLKLDYTFKKNVNKDFFEKLKDQNLSYIINNNISYKYKNINIDTNKILYKEIKDDKIIKNLLEENYLTFFENVYYKSEKTFNLKKYGLDKIIILSNDVKMFKDLLKDNKSNDLDNENYIENLNICVSQNYLPKNKFLMY